MVVRASDSEWWVQIGASREGVALQRAVGGRGLKTCLIDRTRDLPGGDSADHFVACDLDDSPKIEAAFRAFGESNNVVGLDLGVETKTAARSAALLRIEFGLAGIGPEATETLLDRSAWKKNLHDHGILTPATAVLQGSVALDAFLVQHAAAFVYPEPLERSSAGVARLRIGDPRNRELFDEAQKHSAERLVRAEGSVVGDAYSIDGFVHDGVAEVVHFARRFSTRHKRGTLPSGHAFGASRAGERADSDPNWGRAQNLFASVVQALGVDETWFSIQVISDDDGFHVKDVCAHPSRDAAASLRFAGCHPEEILIALELGRGLDTARRQGSGARLDRGFAYRLFYATANGRLEVTDAEGNKERTPDAWAKRPIAATRMEIEWNASEGMTVSRPQSPRDLIATLAVESLDMNSAWMRANQTAPDSLFQVEEPEIPPPPNPRVWPTRESSDEAQSPSTETSRSRVGVSPFIHND